MADHDGHTVNVGPVTVGEPLTPSDAEVERRLAEWLRPHFVGWVLW